MNNTEIIEGYPNYVIHSSGKVWSIKNNKFLKVMYDKRGYNRVDLQFKGCKGKGKMFSIHRLVAMAFIPNTEDKPQVNHVDGNKNNNDVSNLEWATNQENAKHAYDNGLITIGTKLREVTRLRSSTKVLDTETNTIYASIKEAASSNDYNYGKLLLQLLGRKRNDTNLIYL